MARQHKIALIGARGYERQAPQRIDCFPWDRLSPDLNLRDYDTVLINLLSAPHPESGGWDAFDKVFDFSVASEMLRSQGRIIILGDPRLSITKKGKKGVKEPFLSWTGLRFSWDDQGGDTVLLIDESHFRRYSEYLKKLRRWNYSLRHCELDLELFIRTLNLGPLEKGGIHLVAREQCICKNRYGNSLVFTETVAVEQHKDSYYGTDVSTLFAFGPIVFLPETELDEDQSIITILRDLCDVESELPEPVWVSEMPAPGQEAIDTEIHGILARIGSLQDELAQAEERRRAARACLKLLFERGLPLEKSVRDVLRILGADVEDPQEIGKEDGWVTVQLAGRTLEGVLEVKSTKNDQFGEDGIRQLLDWVSRGIELRKRNYKAIFIGNSAVTRPVKERPCPFSDSFQDSTKVGHLVALQCADLYVLHFLNAKGRLNRQQFWQQLFNTDGLFDISSYLELGVQGKNESEA